MIFLLSQSQGSTLANIAAPEANNIFRPFQVCLYYNSSPEYFSYKFAFQKRLISFFIDKNHNPPYTVNKKNTKPSAAGRGEYFMGQEYEIIRHTTIHNFKIFLVSLQYREPHVHGDFELCCLLDGAVTFRSRDKKIQLEKNDFVLLNSCQPHEIYSLDNQAALLLAIQISPVFCKEYFPTISDLDFTFCSGNQFLPGSLGDTFHALMIRLARRYFQKEEGFEFQCTSLLNLVFYHLIRHLPYQVLETADKQKKAARNLRIQKLVRYIEEHYTEKLLLSDLACKEGLTVSYLSHFFKDNFQMSFQGYLASLRCEKARHLLLLTDRNLLDICMESGFSDIKYMTKAFKLRYGCSPKEYRKHFLEADLPQQQKTILSTQDFFSDTSSLVMLEPYRQKVQKHLEECRADDIL